jgi:hypothetical protein
MLLLVFFHLTISHDSKGYNIDTFKKHSPPEYAAINMILLKIILCSSNGVAAQMVSLISLLREKFTLRSFLSD